MARVPQLAGHRPTYQKFVGSILGQDTCLCCKLNPRNGGPAGGSQSIFHSHIDVSFSLFLLSLKINETFKKISQN